MVFLLHFKAAATFRHRKLVFIQLILAHTCTHLDFMKKVQIIFFVFLQKQILQRASNVLFDNNFFFVVLVLVK